MSDAAARLRLRTALVGWFTAVLYFLVSRGVDNFYPFSVYDMYRRPGVGGASRILAIDPSGRPHELHEYAGFACTPGRPAFSETLGARCPGGSDQRYARIPYVERDLQVYFDEHLAETATAPAAASAEALRIVWRSWQLDDRPGPPAHLDCVLAECLAEPRR